MKRSSTFLSRSIPDHADAGGQRRSPLTQTPDIMPAILDIFACQPAAEVTGRSLLPHVSEPEVASDRIVAFGLFAGPVGTTDGRYVMLHYPPDVLGEGLYEYTLMPQHMTGQTSFAQPVSGHPSTSPGKCPS